MAQIGVQRHSRTGSRHISIGDISSTRNRQGFVKTRIYAIAASFVVLMVVLFLVVTFGRTAPVSRGSENRDTGSGSGKSDTTKAWSNLRVGNRDVDSNSIAPGTDAALKAEWAAKAAVAAARAAFAAVEEEDDNSVGTARVGGLLKESTAMEQNAF